MSESHVIEHSPRFEKVQYGFDAETEAAAAIPEEAPLARPVAVSRKDRFRRGIGGFLADRAAPLGVAVVVFTGAAVYDTDWHDAAVGVAAIAVATALAFRRPRADLWRWLRMVAAWTVLAAAVIWLVVVIAGVWGWLVLGLAAIALSLREYRRRSLRD